MYACVALAAAGSRSINANTLAPRCDETPAATPHPVLQDLLVSTTTAATEPSITHFSESHDRMTISITNRYGAPVSLSFGSNAGGPLPIGDPSATVVLDHSSTEYLFPTGWAGRIGVGPNLHDDASKIEGSFTGPPDIDISYMDGFTVPITCSSNGIPVSGCNIDLFQQPNIVCTNQEDGPVCLNPMKDIPNGPAAPFFAACAGAAYTFPTDDDANVAELQSNLVSCCIGISCEAPSRQLQNGKEAPH